MFRLVWTGAVLTRVSLGLRPRYIRVTARGGAGYGCGCGRGVV